MLARVRLAHRAVFVAALGAVLSATVLASAEDAPLPVCATPQPQGPAYAAGTTNTITWTIPSAPTGSIFDIEIATAPDTDPDPDGSFVDANLVQPRIGVNASELEREFTGLEERTYHYHMRSRGKTGICMESPWSDAGDAEPVATTQDATSPHAEITTENPSAHALQVVLEGTATDPAPAGSSSPASGAHQVVVALAHVTPLGTLVFTDQPPEAIATVGNDGSWETTISGIDPGVYAAVATVFDGVGNASDETDPVQVVVVNANVPPPPEQ